MHRRNQLTLVNIPCNKEFCWLVELTSWLLDETGNREISGYGGGGGNLELGDDSLSQGFTDIWSSASWCWMFCFSRLFIGGRRCSAGVGLFGSISGRIIGLGCCCMLANCTRTSLKATLLGRLVAWVCHSRSRIAFWFWKWNVFCV